MRKITLWCFWCFLLAAAGQAQIIRNNVSTTVRMNSDVSVTGQDYGDATGLSFTAAANTQYFIDGWIVYTTSGTLVGIITSVNGPASPTSLSCYLMGAVAANDGEERMFQAYDTAGGALNASISGLNISRLSCYFYNGSNSGTFVVRFAAETAAGTATVKLGSFLQYREVE